MPHEFGEIIVQTLLANDNNKLTNVGVKNINIAIINLFINCFCAFFISSSPADIAFVKSAIP